MRHRKWQEKSERHFRLVRIEVLGAPSFPVPFQSVVPDVLIHTCGTWGWKIHLLCSLWLCGVQWRDENWVLLLCHITGSFSIAISLSPFSCILSMITSVECILLLLLSVIVVLGKPLVIFYKDRCKNFIPCIKSLCLTTSFWICVEHCDFFWQKTVSELTFCNCRGISQKKPVPSTQDSLSSENKSLLWKSPHCMEGCTGWSGKLSVQLLETRHLAAREKCFPTQVTSIFKQETSRKVINHTPYLSLLLSELKCLLALLFLELFISYQQSMELQNTHTEYWTTVISQRMLLGFFFNLHHYLHIYIYVFVSL